MTEPDKHYGPQNFDPLIFSWNHACAMIKSWDQWRNAIPDPLGYPGGPYRGQTPQKGKIKFLVTFFDEIFLSFVESFGTIMQSATIPKNWVLTLFWSIFGPKMTKKEHTLKWPSIFVSQWIFDFIAKINYFGPFLWPIFLKLDIFPFRGETNQKL